MYLYTFFDRVIRQARFRKVAKYIPQDAEVCDIGCGNSPQLLLDLKDKIKSGLGIDRLVESRRWHDKIETKALDLANNPKAVLAGNKFDCVLMLAILEHLPEPEQMLAGIKDILKDKGLLILTTPAPRAKPVLEFLAFRLGLISRQAIGEHKHYFSKKEMQQTLGALGFSDVQHHFFQIGFNQLIVAQK